MTRLTALKATRALFSEGGGTPLNFIEAIGLEADRSNLAPLIRNAASILARWPEPDAAVKEIVAAFFVEPLRALDAADDVLTDVGESMGGKLSRLRAWLGRADPREVERGLSLRQHRRNFALAPAHAPGQADPTGDPIGPSPDENDSRRSLDELQTATDVLALAVRLNGSLSRAIRAAITSIESLRSRSPAGAKSALRKMAQDLRDGVRSAGTTAPAGGGLTTEEHDVAEAAFRAGQDIDRAVQFSREHDELRLSSTGCRMSKKQYISLNLERGV